MAATTPVRIRDSAVYRIYGLVGYDDRLTRGRSPVRFRVDVLFRYLCLVFVLEKNMTGVGLVILKTDNFLSALARGEPLSAAQALLTVDYIMFK